MTIVETHEKFITEVFGAKFYFSPGKGNLIIHKVTLFSSVVFCMLHFIGKKKIKIKAIKQKKANNF